jgi:hypothetical protein
MNFDSQTHDTAKILQDAYDLASWTQDTMLCVLADYIDRHGSLPHFAHYISQRLEDETGHPLYAHDVLSVIPLPSPTEAENSNKVFALPPDAESCKITMGTAYLWIQKNPRGLLVEVYSLDRSYDGPLDSMLTDWEEFAPEGMKVVNVHALLDGGQPHEFDKAVPGVYRIALPNDEQDIAGTALDIFHNTIAIKCLENFTLKVIDDQGIEIFEADDYEAYSGS